MKRADRILLLDWSGAAVVGVVTLLLHDWLSAVGGLPPRVLVGVGLANLVYAAFSFSLWFREPERRLGWITALVVANLAWSVICVGLLIVHWSVVMPLAVLHLGIEAVYVGALGIMEWRVRGLLIHGGAQASPSSTAGISAPRPRGVE